MDIDRAIAVLDDFLALLERHKAATGDAASAIADDIHQNLPKAMAILNAAIGVANVRRPSSPWEWEWWPLREAVLRARGQLESQQEIAEILGPAGPQLRAGELHPWVWGPAAALWSNGHHREAVQSSALSVELELRRKLKVATGDGRHLAQAFRVQPRTKGFSLRRPGFEEGTEDFVSAHDGAAAFGDGCFMAIRNLVTHRLDVDDQEALESLAALSLLARWIDDADAVDLSSSS